MTSVSKTCTKCGGEFDGARTGNQCPDCRRAYNQAYYRNGLGAEIAAKIARKASEPRRTEKPCSGCGKVMLLLDFPVDSRNSEGRSSRCAGCRKDYYHQNSLRINAQMRARNAVNREAVNAAKRDWNRANPERIKAANAASYLKHREVRMAKSAALRRTPKYSLEAAARSAAWRKANPERFAESAARYKANNPELVAKRLRAWMDRNPDKVKAARVRRRKLIAGTTYVPFTAEQLRQRVDFYSAKCWMCGGPYEHLDHVKPLSKGGPHVLSNLRPACKACNLSKKDKWYGVAGIDHFLKI